MTQITAQLTSRGDTSANWTSANPVLASKEIAFTTDEFYSGTNQMKFKVGDGVQTWANLDYMPMGAGGSQTWQQTLTVANGSVLTQNNTISGAFPFSFGVNGSPIDSFNVNTSFAIDHISGDTNTVATEIYQQINQAYILSTPDGYNTDAALYVYASGQSISGNGSNNHLIVEDTISSKGLVGSADYQTNYTPNSYIQKKYITDQLGSSNGIATLDGAGKVPVAQLPNSIMEYKGTWNASTNSPTLADGTGNTGDVYRVTVAGTQNLGSGSISFEIGDYAIYNASGVWEKADTTDAVSSVNGTIGAVTLTGTTNRIDVTGTTWDISNSYVGQTSITTLGTVTTGTIGTGAIIAGATMTLGSDAAYDLYYRNNSGVLTRLGNGTSGKFLAANTSAAPSWETNIGGSDSIIYSGGWHIAPTCAPKTTSTAFNGVVWWFPYPVTTSRTVTDIGIEVTTGVAASNIRLALYGDDGTGRPGNLIEESGAISTAASGLKTYTFASPKNLSASNKFYWLAFQASSGSIAFRVATMIGIVPRSTGAFMGVCTFAQAFGAFPASSAGYSENTSSQYPSIQLKIQ